MIYKYDNYRSFLRSTLVERIHRNSSYSLRAMAKSLDIAPSTLSEVLNGRANLSPQKGAQIAIKLDLNFEEQEFFTLLIQKDTAIKPEIREQIQYRLSKLNPTAGAVRDLSVDAFKAVSEWYHVVIIEMLALKDFEFNTQNLADRLGLTTFEVDAALERLVRLEMLELDENKKYVYVPGRLQVASEGPNVALRKFHKQMLEKAIESLETQTNKEKFVGSETLAFDPKQLEEATQEIEKLCTRLISLARKGDERTEVYHLGFQFFNLTKKKQNKEKRK